MFASRQSQDVRAMLLSIIAAALIIALQVMAKATRDAYFLLEFSAAELPAVMLAGAGVSLLVVLMLGRLMARFLPAPVVTWALVLNSAFFVLEWQLSLSYPSAIAIVLYIHFAGMGAAIVSGFWSIINERFDPHTAKQVIPKIVTGATLGGVAGGFTVWQTKNILSISSILLGLGITSLIAAVVISALGRGNTARSTSEETASRKTEPSRKTDKTRPPKVGYLRYMVVFVVLLAMSETLIDYIFKARADAVLSSPSEFISFFALFHTTIGLLAFAVQSLVTGRVLRSLGLVTTIAALPVLTILGGSTALVFQRLWSISVLKGVSATLKNSFLRSGYELLFTPLTPHKKRSVKSIIDVGGGRLGVALGAGLALVITLLPVDVESILLCVVIAASFVCIAVSWRLQQGYVGALAESLTSGAVHLEQSDVFDATTQKTLMNTAAMLSRKDILAKINAVGQLQERKCGVSPNLSSVSTSTSKDPLDELRCGDPVRIRLHLKDSAELPPECIPIVIRLLNRNTVAPQAMAYLCKHSQQITGQLIDTLLDTSVQHKVRRRLPRVLATTSSQRTINGLTLALQDIDFEIRYRASLGLLRITEQPSAFVVSKKEILEAATAVSLCNEPSLFRQPPLEDDKEFAFWDSPENRERGRALEYLFVLLSTILDREPLQLAYRALATGDQHLRGTALEYLDNVLPPAIKKIIWEHVHSQGQAKKLIRPTKQVLNELLISVDMSGIDLTALRSKTQSPQRKTVD